MNLNLEKKKSEPIETTFLSQVIIIIIIFFLETEVKFGLFIVLVPFPPSKPWPRIE